MTISPKRQCHVVVMLKEPRPGRVKTRLGRDLGMVSAAWWFRRQTASLLRRIRDPRWTLWLAVSPDNEGMQSRIWPTDLPRLPQGTGDLGQRMARIMRELPPGPVIILGADVPGITRSHLARGFGTLGHHDGVIGPSSDGGYWMVGLRRTGAVPARLFEAVRWSSQHARTDSLSTMPDDTVLTDCLDDVDTVNDL